MPLSPWHGGVLTAAAVLASPAAWSALVLGTLPVADALSRFLWCVVSCWVVLNLVLPLMVPSGRADRASGEGDVPAGSAPDATVALEQVPEAGRA